MILNAAHFGPIFIFSSGAMFKRGCGSNFYATYLMFKEQNREVVVAQLVERLLPIPEVRGSNPVIGKNLLILNNYWILSTVY